MCNFFHFEGFIPQSVSVLFSPALNYVWPYYNRHKETLPPAVAAR